MKAAEARLHVQESFSHEEKINLMNTIDKDIEDRAKEGRTSANYYFPKTSRTEFVKAYLVINDYQIEDIEGNTQGFTVRW